MADIVNLRRARKDKVRADDRRTAETNRAAFGRTKDEKRLAKAQAERETRTLDGHRRDKSED